MSNSSSTPAEPGDPRPKPSSDTLIRVVSAAVLAPIAIGAVVLGGWPFVLFWAAAAIGVHWEWTSEILRAPLRPQAVGAAALALAGLLAGLGKPGPGLVVIAAGVALIAVLETDRKAWTAGGLAYAGLVLAGPVLLRPDPDCGLLVILFLFAVVWATDVLAYFGGRLIGGPKLAPPISPGKTWSGGVTGAAGGVAAGVAIAALGGIPNLLAVAGLAFVLSVVSQVGDLFESAVKRRFGVKDSSRIIPGHGGLMDRLDGFLVAAAVAAVIGVARGGFDGAARGLLVW